MSRRIELTIPNDWAQPLRECLEDPERCNFNSKSGKAHMIVELSGPTNTLFFVTIPSPLVSPTLEHLRKAGFGVVVGRIILSSIDYLKPDLSKPLHKEVLSSEEKIKAIEAPKPKALQGYQHFQKVRKTTEELYNEISNNGAMNINTWVNLIGASVMAAGGLTSGMTVFIVASMLVSPIMGPILAMTFGYRIADWKLFKTGFISEFKMATAAFATGFFLGLVLGNIGSSYGWPDPHFITQDSGQQAYILVISIVVSAAAGTVLGISLTSTGGNALVGTAISAGLLPPIVEAGMLCSFSMAFASKETAAAYYRLSIFEVLFYATHVFTIIVVANIIFWLKDIDPRFREGDDSNFDDIPSLVAHKKRLEEMQGQPGGAKMAKLKYFLQNIKDDITEMAVDLKDNLQHGAENIKSIVTEGKLAEHAKTKDHKKREIDDYNKDIELGYSGTIASTVRQRKAGVYESVGQSDDNYNFRQKYKNVDDAVVNPMQDAVIVSSNLTQVTADSIAVKQSLEFNDLQEVEYFDDQEL